MSRLPPLLGRYFGSKWRNAPRYPGPRHDLIIEPFAGGAGYALAHHTKDVVLVEKAKWLADVWAWLISVPPEVIRALPIHEPGETIPAEVQGPARDWVGMWNAFGQARPQEKMVPSAAGGNGKYRGYFWCKNYRDRSAETVQQIRHWRIINASYRAIPTGEATWFVDPPYVGLNHYGQGAIDYEHLGSWCLERRGQVIVCENEGADWLPFWPFRDSHASPRGGKGRRSKEAICTWRTTENGFIVG